MLNRAAYGHTQKKIAIAIHFFYNHHSSLTYPLGSSDKAQVYPNGLVDINITQAFGKHIYPNYSKHWP